MSSLLTLEPAETTDDTYNVLVGSPHFIEFREVGVGGLGNDSENERVEETNRIKSS